MGLTTSEIIDRINFIEAVIGNVKRGLYFDIFYEDYETETQLKDEEIAKKNLIEAKIEEMVKIAVKLPKIPKI
jgi:hypothetical protein